MTIDTSQLNPEQRAFLKATPGFLQSLEQAANQQARQLKHEEDGFSLPEELVSAVDEASKKQREIRKKATRMKRRMQSLKRSKSREQREMAQLNRKLRNWKFGLELPLRKIVEEMEQRDFKSSLSDLLCPECGDRDTGNRWNGKPWCFKCKRQMVRRDKLEKQKKMANVKKTEKSLKDEFKRRGLDF